MKKIFFTILILFILGKNESLGQCDIKNKVIADGSMIYYIDPTVFYKTKSKSLKINIISDKESYYVALQPTPFPSKEEGKKIKDDLVILLNDNKTYNLKHYDTQYIKNDSVMQVLYLIDDKDITSFSTFDAVVASINMKGTEFVRDYTFKLHKDAIVKQLACFLKEEEK